MILVYLQPKRDRILSWIYKGLKYTTLTTASEPDAVGCDPGKTSLLPFPLFNKMLTLKFY